MKRVVINNFSRGIADDRYGGSTGEFAFSKNFDILTHPRRLQPLRGMEADTADTGIGNIIVGSDGLMHAVGKDIPNNPTLGKLWRRSGYGVSDDYATGSNAQLSGAAVNYDLLVDWPDAGHTRTIRWASTNLIVASDPAHGSSAATQALTFTTIGQGLVHPKDKKFYFPYKTSSTHYIGIETANASAFGAWNATGLALQFHYRAYCLSHYGDYLAIPLTSTQGIGVHGSQVALWGRDTSLTTFDELIPWGAGNLKVLNNLQGVLIGISSKSANITESFQDHDSIMIKAWNGGPEPTLIKEIKAVHIPGTSNPSVTINPRVNFVYQNRLYFSVNIDPGDSIQPAWYGLWSVGKNKLTGEWTVVLEHGATDDYSDTGIIAAALQGDFLSVAHTAEGTLTCSDNGAGSGWGDAYYESLVNPGMSEEDKPLKKKILSVSVNTLPLLSNATVTLKYRVDSDGDDADWTTLRTFSTDGEVAFDTGGLTLTDGYNFEFRLESFGAVITSFSYRYQEVTTNV